LENILIKIHRQLKCCHHEERSDVVISIFKVSEEIATPPEADRNDNNLKSKKT